ncbi:F0F1 ATP synthase subunit epsilon [Phaeospirillum tilakii]|uniref:F0F1 ATP synthase subunit epsilon n=1 Tax=Phaeospirillum tilakii TaxID=741673 RepID=A0ABW5CB92_9PROT
MKLVIATPTRILVERDDVAALRAEDATGWFGLRPGHADFLTVLEPSVVSWSDQGGAEHYAAVRGGVLTVRGGAEIEIASREAFVGADLDQVEESLAALAARDRDARAEARAGAAHLEAAALRHLRDYLATLPGERR